jgi:hypothetical protein
MRALHVFTAVLFMAAVTLSSAAQAQSVAGAIGQAAVDIAVNEVVNGTIQDALSPNDKQDPARYKVYSDVIDDAKLLHPLVIKQLKSIAGSNEYWTGAQFRLYIAPSQAKFNIEKTRSGNTTKPAVTLIVMAAEKQAMLDVSPQLTTGLPGNVQSAIVYRIMLPNFQKGHMQRGIVDGTRAVLMALQGAYTRPSPAVVPKPTPYNWTPLIVLFLVAAGALNRPGRYVPRDGYYGTRPGGARGYW